MVVKVCVAVVVPYRRYRSSHWLYDNPQRIEDQNILNVHRLLVTWLVTYLKQTEQWYLEGHGFRCTSPARANSRSSG